MKKKVQPLNGSYVNANDFEGGEIGIGAYLITPGIQIESLTTVTSSMKGKYFTLHTSK